MAVNGTNGTASHPVNGDGTHGIQVIDENKEFTFVFMPSLQTVEEHRELTEIDNVEHPCRSTSKKRTS
jgi:hypothetical protein